jgi:hypothetical protein
MKKLALAALLLAVPLLSAVKVDKPNPAEFTLKVHVISSASRTEYNGTYATNYQVVEATVDGQPVELHGNS